MIDFKMKFPLSKEQLVRDLKAIGIQEGDHIGVSLSFKSIGYLKGGPDSFIDALLEALGSNGTIMMNTYTKQFHLSKIASGKVNYTFDYRNTPATTGIIPETLRKRKGSIRSRHPICSVTAIGRYSRYLTKDHDQNSSPYAPYSRLGKIRGKVLCIGIGDRIVALRHEPQYLAGLLSMIPPSFGVKYRDDEGNIRLFIRKEEGGCTKKLPEFVPSLKKMGIVKDGRIGQAYSTLVLAKDYLMVMTDVLKNNPELNLCNSISCLWCRELERRMALYEKIRDPKFFQRNYLIIRILAMINLLRLKNYVTDETIRTISVVMNEKRNPLTELNKSLYLKLFGFRTKS